MTHGKVVFCLQEVSYQWCGKLSAWFSNRGFQLVSANYGKKFNGYMGVALAFPLKDFEAVDVNIARLSDEREGGWPRDEETITLASQLWTGVQSFVTASLNVFGFMPQSRDDKPIDHWQMSERRFNAMITVQLKDKETGHAFCVGT